MPDEKQTPAEDGPQLRRKPDQAAVVEKPVEEQPVAEPEAPVAEEASASEEVIPVLPTLVPPYRVEGIGVFDSAGTLVAAAGAPHHSLANHLAIANVIASALNRG